MPKRDKLTRPKRVETDGACDGKGVLLRRKWKEKTAKQNLNEMDGDMQCHPKHLPRLVPKRDKSSCSERAETAKACDGEGVLLRRKWKEKPVRVKNITKPKGTKISSGGVTTDCRSTLARNRCCKRGIGKSFQPMDNQRDEKIFIKPSDRSTERTLHLKRAPFRPMETIEEEETFAAFFERMYSKMIDVRLKFLDDYDKGAARVTPFFWQSLAYWWDLVSSVRRDDWAPKHFRNSEAYVERVIVTLCKVWRLKARDMRNEWKEEQKSSIVEDEESIRAISPDDDERTVPTSNRAPDQTEEWENLDDDDSGSAEQEQMICVFDDLKYEGSKIFCKVNGTNLERTFTLRVLRTDIKMCPKFEGPGLGETFNLEVGLDEQDSTDPFLGDARGERVLGKPPEKSYGVLSLDKTLSGEYVLGRPPKKPGRKLSQTLLLIPLLLTGVACECIEDEDSRKWGIKHVLLSMLFIVVLVKIKNWIVRARVKSYILRTFEDRADKYLSQFKSRNNLVCYEVKKAMWKDLNRQLKTTAKGNDKSRGRKTLVKRYEEKFDDYFAKLETERSKWEWAGILRLEQICNQDK